MPIMTRIIALTRAVQLRRQFHDIGRALDDMEPVERRQLAELTLREVARAARSEFPHLYATPPEEKYSLWGSGTGIGLQRTRSDSRQVRLRGVALWLAVAYHETHESPFPEHQELHRQIMRTLRVLRELLPPPGNGTSAGLDEIRVA